MPAEPLHVVLSIRTTCPRCNAAVPLDRPRQGTRCGECGAEVPLGEALWHEVLRDPHTSWEDQQGQGRWALADGRLRGRWRAAPGPAACPACGAAVRERDDAGAADGAAHRIPCASCGAALESAPAPEWLRGLYPAAARLLLLPSEADERTPESPEPLPCPRCEAPIALDASSPRTVPCAHCGGRFYLPQKTWRTLHPPAPERSWTVRLHGEPAPAPAEPGRDGPPLPAPATEPRGDASWVALALRTTCPDCNGNVPLDGPRRATRCPDCLAELPLDALWGTALRDAHASWHDRREHSGGWQLIDGSLRGDWALCAPCCPRCGAAVGAQAVAPGTDQRWSCPRCAEPFDTFPPPPWLRAAYPAVAQVVAVSRDGASAPDAGRASPELAGSGGAVAMRCPGCGAPLEVEAGSPRTVPCEYCSRRVYLSDALWSALHPRPPVRRWLACLAGPVPEPAADDADEDPFDGPPPETGVTDEAIHCSFAIRTTCPHCNGGVPLGGPMRAARCLKCYGEVPLDGALWAEVFGTPTAGWEEHLREWEGKGGWRLLDGSLRGEWQLGAPGCPACGAAAPASLHAPGTEERVHCAGCERSLEAFPPPDWLRALHPQVERLYFAEREPAATTTEAAAAAPVALECPGCSASLVVDDGSPRTVRCEYCRADVHIPDALWLALHPARTITRWWARLARSR